MRLFLFFILASTIGFSQTMDEWVLDPDYIKSVTFNKPAENMLPVYELGERIRISFDDVIGDEANYYYQIEHYDHNWVPSKLFKNEFLAGYDDQRIIDYRNSFTTIQGYSHYEFSIPNRFIQGLKVSGNYMVHFYDEDRNLVFSRRFMVVENRAAVGVAVKRRRDLKLVDEMQRLEYFVDSQEINFINPAQTLKTVLVQNADLNSIIYGPKPQYNVANKQVYDYDAPTSFWAGNEYLNFENRDFRAPNLNINRVVKGDLYNAILFIDRPRIYEPYTFFPDINGNFQIATLDNEDNAVQAEYVNIHFKLELKEELKAGERIFVYGNYNAFQLQPENELRFNPETGLFETVILLKQGFYNYKYVVTDKFGKILHGRICGNKWQTENEYTVLAYYRAPGARYDRLVGVGSANSENIGN